MTRLPARLADHEDSRTRDRCTGSREDAAESWLARTSGDDLAEVAVCPRCQRTVDTFAD